MTKRHAVALRAFTHADDSFAAGQVILGMEPGHFNDWSAEGVDLVRAATDAEIAKAKGDKPAPAPAPKPAATPKAPRKPKAAAKNTKVPEAPAPNPDPAPAAAPTV